MFFTVYKFTSVLYCKSVFLILPIRLGSKQGSNHDYNSLKPELWYRWYYGRGKYAFMKLLSYEEISFFNYS